MLRLGRGLLSALLATAKVIQAFNKTGDWRQQLLDKCKDLVQQSYDCVKEVQDWLKDVHMQPVYLTGAVAGKSIAPPAQVRPRGRTEQQERAVL